MYLYFTYFLIIIYQVLIHLSPTFLTSILMTVATLHVIPLVVQLQTKGVNTIFFSEIIRLVPRPSCKVRPSNIRPSKVTFCWSVVQSQPRFLAIMSVLDVDIFLIVVHINKSGDFVLTFWLCIGPVCAGFAREVAEAFKITPSRFTNICTNIKCLLALFVRDKRIIRVG